MSNFKFTPYRVLVLLAVATLTTLAIFLLLGGVARAQETSAEITPSFGDGKLKVLGAGFKPNENVTITVTLDSGTHTFTVTANAQGEFELDTGLDVPPLSSVELDARGDQGSGAPLSRALRLPYHYHRLARMKHPCVRHSLSA